MNNNKHQLIKKYVNIIIPMLFFYRLINVFIIYHIHTILSGKDNALLYVTDMMRGWSGLSGMICRRVSLRFILGVAVAKNITVYDSLLSKSGIKIGENTYIGYGCNIGWAIISNDVLIADNVMILSGKNQYGIQDTTKPIKDQPGSFECIQIASGCWIGAASIIMANVGEGAIVAAGSVVTKTVHAFSIVAGNPAVVIRRRGNLSMDDKQR